LQDSPQEILRRNVLVRRRADVAALAAPSVIASAGAAVAVADVGTSGSWSLEACAAGGAGNGGSAEVACAVAAAEDGVLLMLLKDGVRAPGGCLSAGLLPLYRVLHGAFTAA